jgi:hypothetical protein
MQNVAFFFAQHFDDVLAFFFVKNKGSCGFGYGWIVEQLHNLKLNSCF